MEHQTVIQMFDGTAQYGPVGAGLEGPVSAFIQSRLPRGKKQIQLHLDEGQQRVVEMDSVKVIHTNAEAGLELPATIRFFDTAPTPSSLWVRITFLDGEIVEGMIANAWSALNSNFVQMHTSNQQVDQKHILIPRSSISDLQIIATR